MDMDSVRQKHKRGFTLAELLVAITVGLIVIAALMSLVVMMNSYLMKRTATSKLSSELYHIKNEVSEWFYRYDTEKYELYMGAEDGTAALKLSKSDTDPLDIVTLHFLSEEKQFDGISDPYIYSLIQDVEFDYDENLSDVVKCTVIYTADGKTGEYSFVLTKRAQTAQP